MIHILHNASKDEEISQRLEIPDKQAGIIDAGVKENGQEDNLFISRCRLIKVQSVPISGAFAELHTSDSNPRAISPLFSVQSGKLSGRFLVSFPVVFRSISVGFLVQNRLRMLYQKQRGEFPQRKGKR
jgi:hypothetical protein